MQTNDEYNSDTPKPENRFYKFCKRWWRLGLIILVAAVTITITYKLIFHVSPLMQFLTTSLILFFTLLAIAYQASIYNRQANYMKGQAGIMQGQLDEMKRQADLMKDSLAETKIIAEQNARLTIASEAQRDAMQGQLDVMQASLSQNERAVKASEAQAATSQAMVEITREAFVTAERAYIGIQEVTMIDFHLGKIPKVLVVLINAGKTPAWNVRSKSGVSLYASPPTYSELMSAPIQFLARSVPADRPMQLDCDFGFTLTPEILSKIIAKQLKLFVRAEITFLDISNTEQAFSFCLAYRPAYGIFRDCRDSEYRPEDEKPN